MKFSFPKFKIPALTMPKFNLSKPSFGFFGKTTRLNRIWSKFLKQIPPTYRHFIQSYPRHFIVIGAEGSGKSSLIQKFIDQERDVYSFETSYTNESEVQFYLGQRYILQEISWSLVEDRSILAKKQLTSLWNSLYTHRDPVFVVTFNPIQWRNSDPEKINHYARLLLNKVTLLSHLLDKPIQVRVALTKMDAIEGYSEFCRNLQVLNTSLDVDLTNYSGETLKDAFKSYEEYLPLMLESSSAEDYLKILNFLKEIKDLTPCIDQFVRSLTQKEYEKKILILEKGYFLSNHESDIGSELFDCKQDIAPSVYIKRHYLKHQTTCASLAMVGCLCLAGFVYHKKGELNNIRSKVALLERYQKQECLADIVPYIQTLKNTSTPVANISKLQPIYHTSFQQQRDDFVNYSREYVLHPTFRKMVLNNQSEVEMIYFLSLVKATNNNRLGKLILENVSEWAEVLGLSEDFVSLYIHLANTPQTSKHYLEEFNALCSQTPFSDTTPWFRFFNQVQNVVDTPHTLETYLADLKGQADKLLTSLVKLDKHPLTGFLCKTLMEDEEIKEQNQFLPKIQLLQDLRINSETLQGLLTTIVNQSLESPSYGNKSVKDFLGALDEFLISNEYENSSYHFILGGKRWKFESQDWVDLFTQPRVKKVVEDYLVQNREEGIGVFFKNYPKLLSLDFSFLSEHFPKFKEKKPIPSYFTMSAYEKNVFTIADKLAKLNQSKHISSEVKNDLSQFIAQEVEAYAREYKKHYEEALGCFEVNPSTFDEAVSIINFMVEPLSSFSHFLNTFRSNLKIPQSDSLVLHSMNHLSDLAFFQKLLPEDLDKPGEVHNYQAFLRGMLQDVRKGSIAKSDSECGVLENYLNPLSRMSLAILTDNNTSYSAKLDEWFTEAKVPHKYQPFFANPVKWIHDLGLRELEQSITHAWCKECESEFMTLFQKFPFDRNSQDYVKVEELEKLLNPSSSFWTKAHEILGCVSRQEDNKWTCCYPEALKLNKKIYDQVNLMAHARNMLWDKEGNKQPLRFAVKTVPFSGKIGEDKNPILSYLITSEQTIFNANQQPHFRNLEINWWNPEEILVGFELMEKGSDHKSYKNMKIEDGEWNMFQLLNKGHQKNENIWCWNIPEVENEQVSLFFEQNPWSVLNAAL